MSHSIYSNHSEVGKEWKGGGLSKVLYGGRVSSSPRFYPSPLVQTLLILHARRVVIRPKFFIPFPYLYLVAISFMLPLH